MRGLLVFLLLTVIGAILTGCEPPEARPERTAPAALAARAPHGRRHVALRSLLHARGHVERIADALYDDDDDGEDDDTELAAPPQPSDDEAAPGLLVVELPEDPPPSDDATRHPPGRGLGPSSGHPRTDETPPRS